MGKKILALAACAALSACLAGCSASSDAGDGPAESEAKGQSSFEVVKADGNNESGKELSFEEANVLTFSLQNRDDGSSEYVETLFSVANNGAEDVSDLTIDFAGVDTDGNVISEDGRVNDFGVPAGKSAFVESYMSVDEGYSKSDVGNVEVASYAYRSGDSVYEVDLKSKQVERHEPDDSNLLDFDSANVVSFEYEDKGRAGSDSYETGMRVYNDSEKLISNLSVSVAYFDGEGNYLGRDRRGSEIALEPGNFVNMDSFYTNPDLFDQVASFGVFYYSYDLSQDDENGWNHYEVNLKTGEAVGWHEG